MGDCWTTGTLEDFLRSERFRAINPHIHLRGKIFERSGVECIFRTSAYEILLPDYTRRARVVPKGLFVVGEQNHRITLLIQNPNNYYFARNLKIIGRICWFLAPSVTHGPRTGVGRIDFLPPTQKAKNRVGFIARNTLVRGNISRFSFR